MKCLIGIVCIIGVTGIVVCEIWVSGVMIKMLSEKFKMKVHSLYCVFFIVGSHVI